MPKISAKLKRGHPERKRQMQVWGGLNAGAVAENGRLSTQSVVNLGYLARSQVYHADGASTLFDCSTFAVVRRVARVCRGDS